jgi:hypothetical protein
MPLKVGREDDLSTVNFLSDIGDGELNIPYVEFDRRLGLGAAGRIVLNVEIRVLAFTRGMGWREALWGTTTLPLIGV